MAGSGSGLAVVGIGRADDRHRAKLRGAGGARPPAHSSMITGAQRPKTTFMMMLCPEVSSRPK